MTTEFDAKASRALMEALLMERVSRDEDSRKEALRDYLCLTQASTDQDTADALAAMIPPVLPSLYRKWVRQFLGRLFETAQPEQLTVLADGSAENAAALTMAFLMFMESERMEKQVAEDLRAFGAAQSGAGPKAELADLAADYIRARVAILAKEQEAKDEAVKN